MTPSLDEVVEAVERDDYTGFCGGCGAEATNVEPDATGYPCEDCGENKVKGAEMWLLLLCP